MKKASLRKKKAKAPRRTYVRFRARVSKQGPRLVIVIPKALQEMISSLRGKELLLELKEFEVKKVRKKLKRR